ncbi:MAG: serine hydrolase, partial [Flavipsychrobacter sp.]
AQLDTLELYPFRQLIRAGVQSIMVAHLNVPALDTGAHMATTLSRNTVTGLLRQKLGFKGLIFTDALNMKGVTKYYEPGEVDLRAFLAGNDVLLFSQDVPTAIAKIKTAIDSGIVTQADLEQRVKKILAAKYDAGLAKRAYINPAHATEDLNRYTDALKEQIAKAAVTVIRDENGIINKVNRNMHVAYLGINADTATLLYQQLRDSMRIIIPAFWVSKNKPVDSNLLEQLAYFDAVIVAIHNTSLYPGYSGNYGLTDDQVALVKQVQTLGNTMVTVMGNAYIMQNFCEARSALVAYEDDSVTEHVVANLFLRKFKPKGKLPVTACKIMPLYAARVIPVKKAPAPLTKTIFPVDAGVVAPEALYKLDLFLQRCIVDQAFPGCRVVASKNGIVFFDKSFGYYTYYKQRPVDTNTIYDLASLTKVVATDLAVMRLYDQGKIHLDKTLGDYLPWTRGTNKAGLHIRDLLLHQAGLKSWMPFYKETLDASGNPRAGLYADKPSSKYSIRVSKDMYLRNDYPDTIWNEILNSPLENLGKYVYSDLDYYFLAAIVQRLSGKTIDKYVDEQFYKPMGLTHIGYLPLTKFDSANIAPTENDIVFRHSQLQGYVHDQGAALFGGVQGHAGVFATADDVAAIFQMFLNKGEYNGKRFVKASTIEYFSQYNSRISRRGIGFDKPNADADDGGPAGDRTTGYAFGHQGYTGTCAWADPATGVVFVFLSNRLYPDAEGKSSNKINHLNVRTISQDYIYEALGIPVNHDRPEVYKKEISEQY